MTLSSMSRRDRTIFACIGVVALYGIAALIWFTGREAAWAKAKKGYQRAAAQVQRENKLIRERALWEEREAEAMARMPKAEKGRSTNTRWMRQLDALAEQEDHRVLLSDKNAEKKEEQYGEVWELPIDVKYEASLGHLVKFLFALEHAEDAMFDVRALDISTSTKNKGFLSGSFTLTCAYMKGSEE